AAPEPAARPAHTAQRHERNERCNREPGERCERGRRDPRQRSSRRRDGNGHDAPSQPYQARQAQAARPQQQPRLQAETGPPQAHAQPQKKKPKQPRAQQAKAADTVEPATLVQPEVPLKPVAASIAGAVAQEPRTGSDNAPESEVATSMVATPAPAVEA